MPSTSFSRDAMVTDATWEVLAAELGVQQLMDLVFTVGAYDALAMAFRSFADSARRRPGLRTAFSFPETH